MEQSTNTTLATNVDMSRPFFKDDCLYVELDYLNHPGLIKAMLLAGMPEGSRIVAKFDDGDSRYEIYDIEYQPTRTIRDVLLQERYYLQASQHKIDHDDWYQFESRVQDYGGWNCVIIPALPDFNAHMFIETDKVTQS